MNWDKVHSSFKTELGKIAAFHVGNLSPETVMNNSMPPGPMETAGLQTARNVLSRMNQPQPQEQQKVAATSRHKDDHAYVKTRPWISRSIGGAGVGGMLASLTDAGKKRSVMDKIRKKNLPANMQKRRVVGAALGTSAALADKIYMEIYRKEDERRRKPKTKSATITDPIASLRSAQKIGRFSRVATTNTMGKAGPGIKQQVPLIGRKGILPGLK